uniref:VPS37D subunit of ESCRT-I n=1 Tax=Pseudonaja textilis TaxID=8673 RepID=A0A670Z0U4_PSETE
MKQAKNLTASRAFPPPWPYLGFGALSTAQLRALMRDETWLERIVKLSRKEQMEQFLCWDLPIESFVESFQHSRMLSHLRRTQLEKLQEILKVEKAKTPEKPSPSCEEEQPAVSPALPTPPPPSAQAAPAQNNGPPPKVFQLHSISTPPPHHPPPPQAVWLAGLIQCYYMYRWPRPQGSCALPPPFPLEK